MKRQQIEPYLQGDLDALCGIYAIINGVALCLPHLRGTEFFADLFDDLVKASGSRTQSFLLHGIGIADTARLIEAARLSVKWRLSLTLVYSRPFKRSNLRQRKGYLQRLQEHIDQDGTACVIALGHRYFRYHWTAVRAVTDRTLKIADSCNNKSVGMETLLTNCRSAKDKRSWKPQATFFIQIGGDALAQGETDVV